jgi:hypothetical protein
VFDDVEVPMFASRIQYADLRAWDGGDAHRGWQTLLSWVALALGQGQAPVANPETEAGRVWLTLADSEDVHELELFEQTFRTSPEARLAFARRAGLVWARLRVSGSADDWRVFIRTFAGTPEAREAGSLHYERELAALHESEDMTALDAFIAEFDGTEGALKTRRQRVVLGQWLTADRKTAAGVSAWLAANAGHAYAGVAERTQERLRWEEAAAAEREQVAKRQKSADGKAAAFATATVLGVLGAFLVWSLYAAETQRQIEAFQ